MDLADAIFAALKDSNIYAKHGDLLETLLCEAAEEQGIDEARIQVLDMLVTLRRTVPDCACTYHGLDQFLKSSDLLLRLCALQIIIQNANSQHDFDLLAVEGGILEYLMANGLPEPCEFALNEEPIYCKTLQLVANLLRVPTTNWSSFIEKLATALKVCMDETGEAQKDAIFTTGCMTVNRSVSDSLNGILLETYLELFPSSSHDVKGACLSSAAVVLEAGVEAVKKDVVEVGLGSMGPSGPVANLLECCKSSFDELKDTSYACLRQIVLSQELFQSALASSDVFSFLQDREADSSSSGLQWKYTIIKELMEKEWAGSVLNEAMSESLHKYLAQGPFYASAPPAVALDSQ